jgi:hypothetical protein
MKTILAYLASACSDDSTVSLARLLSLVTVPLVVLVPLTIWAVMSIHARALLEFPGSLTTFIGAVNTFVLGHQFLNKREETAQAANQASSKP